MAVFDILVNNADRNGDHIEERDGIEHLHEQLAGEFGETLAGLLLAQEVAEFAAWCDRLLAEGSFPKPSGRMPEVPWSFFDCFC